MLSEAIQLQRAKDTYNHSLAQIDRSLRDSVRKDPDLLRDAEGLQRSFTAIDYTPAPLTRTLEQPDE